MMLPLDSETLSSAIGIFQNIIANVDAKIPTGASANNQLADKAYVDDSINASSAYFKGSFATRAALMAVNWQTSNKNSDNFVTNNDYAYVEADESHNNEIWRYIFVYQTGGQDNGWHAQYKVNEAPFSQAQLDAINSGATSASIAQFTSLASEIADLVAYANSLNNQQQS